MPQNLKTKPIAIDASDLPELDPRDQEFVRLVVSGKSASEAFRATRDCSDWLPSSVWCKASLLRNDVKVQKWIEAAQIAGASDVTVTYERHIRELERLKQLSIASGNMGAAVQCEQTIGKAAGLHVEQVRDVTQRTEPADMLREIAITSPAAAAALAAEHGIELPNLSTTKH